MRRRRHVADKPDTFDVSPINFLFDQIETFRTWAQLRNTVNILLEEVNEATSVGVRGTLLLILTIINKHTCQGDVTDIELVTARMKHDWETRLRPILEEEFKD
jgi:hypothetical protein